MSPVIPWTKKWPKTRAGRRRHTSNGEAEGPQVRKTGGMMELLSAMTPVGGGQKSNRYGTLACWNISQAMFAMPNDE